MPKFQRHIFVCVNERDPASSRGCCASKDSARVAKALKIKAYERGLKRVVRVNKAGCLDQCGNGVACVVYPEAVWYGGVTLDDVDEIVEKHLIGGEPVARLVIPDEKLTGRVPEAQP